MYYLRSSPISRRKYEHVAPRSVRRKRLLKGDFMCHIYSSSAPTPCCYSSSAPQALSTPIGCNYLKSSDTSSERLFARSSRAKLDVDDIASRSERAAPTKRYRRSFTAISHDAASSDANFISSNIAEAAHRSATVAEVFMKRRFHHGNRKICAEPLRDIIDAGSRARRVLF